MSQSNAHPFDVLLNIERNSRNRVRGESNEHMLSADMTGRLALRLQNWRLMVPMDDISELSPVPAITQVPAVKPWFMGITNLRGTIISVTNLAQFIAQRPSIPTANSRIAVVSAGEWTCGLLIDGVLGTRHFTARHEIPLADAVDHPGLHPYISQAYRHEDQTWLTFNVAALLADPKFLNAAL